MLGLIKSWRISTWKEKAVDRQRKVAKFAKERILYLGEEEKKISILRDFTEKEKILFREITKERNFVFLWNEKATVKLQWREIL